MAISLLTSRAKLKYLVKQLEACQKSLSEYLDAKRNAFPRFYFISDDELLSILGSQSADAVQNHIPKMFDNIESLQLQSSGGKMSIIGLISTEKENLQFL